jgi:hypothetical protein
LKLIAQFHYTSITFERALDILLHQECCICAVDPITKNWRIGIYLCHWNVSKKILIRYVPRIFGNTYAIFEFHDDDDNNYNIGYVPIEFRVDSRTLQDCSDLSESQINNFTEKYKK